MAIKTPEDDTARRIREEAERIALRPCCTSCHPYVRMAVEKARRLAEIDAPKPV